MTAVASMLQSEPGGGEAPPQDGPLRGPAPGMADAPRRGRRAAGAAAARANTRRSGLSRMAGAGDAEDPSAAPPPEMWADFVTDQSRRRSSAQVGLALPAIRPSLDVR